MINVNYLNLYLKTNISHTIIQKFVKNLQTTTILIIKEVNVESTKVLHIN